MKSKVVRAGCEKAKRVNVFIQKAAGRFTGWAGDGPWRSRSVLAALGVALVGLGFWCSDLRSPPPNEPNHAPVSASDATPPNTAGAPAGARWSWGRPFPFYVRMGVSYAAGFCLGWFFRKLTRLILVGVALGIALLAYGKLTGCDMTHAQEQVRRSGAWAQHEATTARDYLLHALPSATAGGTGIFLGFRRRHQAAAPAKPAD